MHHLLVGFPSRTQRRNKPTWEMVPTLAEHDGVSAGTSHTCCLGRCLCLHYLIGETCSPPTPHHSHPCVHLLRDESCFDTKKTIKLERGALLLLRWPFLSLHHFHIPPFLLFHSDRWRSQGHSDAYLYLRSGNEKPSPPGLSEVKVQRDRCWPAQTLRAASSV